MNPTTLTVDAVLFDSDGVLVDSHHQVDDAWTALTVELGLDTERVLREAHGIPARQTLRRFVDAELLEAAVDRLEQLEVELSADTAPVPGALELTSRLPVGSWAIVTSASRRLGLARWTAAGIRPPPHVVTADDVSTGKPHPEPYLTAATMLGVAPGRCLVVEDSAAGGRAAVAAGAAVVAVGGLDWDVEPVARVRDLTSLSVAAHPGGLSVRIG